MYNNEDDEDYGYDDYGEDGYDYRDISGPQQEEQNQIFRIGMNFVELSYSIMYTGYGNAYLTYLDFIDRPMNDVPSSVVREMEVDPFVHNVLDTIQLMCKSAEFMNELNTFMSKPNLYDWFLFPEFDSTVQSISEICDKLSMMVTPVNISEFRKRKHYSIYISQFMPECMKRFFPIFDMARRAHSMKMPLKSIKGLLAILKMVETDSALCNEENKELTKPIEDNKDGSYIDNALIKDMYIKYHKNGLRCTYEELEGEIWGVHPNTYLKFVSFCFVLELTFYLSLMKTKHVDGNEGKKFIAEVDREFNLLGKLPWDEIDEITSLDRIALDSYALFAESLNFIKDEIGNIMILTGMASSLNITSIFDNQLTILSHEFLYVKGFIR